VCYLFFSSVVEHSCSELLLWLSTLVHWGARAAERVLRATPRFGFVFTICSLPPEDFISASVLAHRLWLVLSFLFSMPGVKGALTEICFLLKRTEKSFISRFGSSLGTIVFLTDPSFHRLASFLASADLLFSCCASRQPRSFPAQRVWFSIFIAPGVILGSGDRLIFSLFVPPFWSRFIYVARSLVPDSVPRTPFSCISSSFYRQIQSPCF
jgi:hypothetical protein